MDASMNAEAQPTRVVPPSRRRDKPILSCTLCRRRKLKCDRHSPCRTCVERGLSLSCTYVRNPVTPQEPKAPSSVHNRIDQLERLVTSLMSGKEVDHASPALSLGSHLEQNSDDPEDAGTPDRMRLGNDTTRYTNSSHWTSILDGISELKEHLDEIPASAHSKDDDLEDIVGPDLLFGRQRHVSKQELLGALPPRAEADQLIETCFVAMRATPAPVFLHMPSFFKAYNDFWQRPFEVSTMWLGLLFSMLALGARFRAESEVSSTNPEDDSRRLLCSAQMDFYREKVTQCLVLAKYTQCPPYTMETLLLYFATETFRSTDTQFSMWILVGMIVRVAFRMGYHREPSRFPNISPFKAEIRRRTWLVVVSIDLVTSSQVGLPRMVQPFMYDTREPGNYLEDDIHEHLTELPPSRPEVEVTPLLYTLIQTRLMGTYAKIMDLVNINSQPPYREIMVLDAGLRHVYDKIPTSIKPIPAREFETTVTPTTIRRLYICLAFLRANLVLHRPYLLLGRTDSRYEYSRRACLSAALEMLAFQSIIHNSVQSHGYLGYTNIPVSLYSSPILNHDFSLATTVLILDLDRDTERDTTTTTTTTPTSPLPPTSDFPTNREPPTRHSIIAALQTSHTTWSRLSKRSHDARRIVAAINVVLRRANALPRRPQMPEEEEEEAYDTPPFSSHQSHDFDLLPGLESTMSHHPFSSPAFSSPSLHFNNVDFGAHALDPSFFHLQQGPDYASPLGIDDLDASASLSMHLGGFPNPFDWTGMSR